MSVFKYFKNIPGRPPIGRQAQCVIFFSNLQRSPWRKKKQALSPVGGATGPPFFSRTFIFAGTYFELFERVFVIIVGKISAANSYRT